MSSEDVINGADLFLREVPNVKIGYLFQHILKVELNNI